MKPESAAHPGHSKRLSRQVAGGEAAGQPDKLHAKPKAEPSRGSEEPSFEALQTRQLLGKLPSPGLPFGAVDGCAGKNLRAALGGRTPAECASNVEHLAKMELSTTVVSTIEKLPGRLNSIAAFKVKDAFRLYEHCFPNEDEREPVKDIKDRVKAYDGKLPEDGGDFHAHVYADRDGAVVGYSQGSTVPTPDGGLFYYWQYGCVADREYMKKHYNQDVNPREHGVLNTIHGVNGATLQATADRVKKPALGMVWESEPRGLGEDAGSIRFTDTRLSIHTRAGGRVMMGMTADGELVNLHLQPSLGEGKQAIALHMMYRPLKYEPGEEKRRGELSKDSASGIMLGWIENFRREGFAEKDVKQAEDEIKARLAKSVKIVLLPADQVPDVVALATKDRILRKQIFEMYGVDSLDAAGEFYRAAMKRAA